MCGIYGILANQGNLFKSDQILPYLKTRGPDFTGEFYFKTGHRIIHLYHTRLAVLDLSSNGNQPMQDKNSDWVIVYNGEIYNFIEVKKELNSLGWDFFSNTDTEVLLKAWSQWGINCLYRLNGMFAFAVFHKKTNDLWLVRDRFGVKPLHWGYSNLNERFVFSSSLVAVAKSIETSVDTNACAHGLRYLAYDTGNQVTTFKNVQSIPQGGWLKLNIVDGVVSCKSGIWYKLKNEIEKKRSQNHQLTEAEIIEQCHDNFVDAVKLRLRSDVPLAVSLSAGLDSSSIASTAIKFIPSINGFTYGSKNAASSEGPEVEKFAKQIGLTAHYIWPKASPDQLDNLLERTLSSQESPFSGFSVMAQNEVFRIVRQSGFKVLLGGQGGDETFAGYRKFFLVALRNAIKKGEIISSFHFLYSLGLMLIHEASSASTYLQNLDRYYSKQDHSFTLLKWNAPNLDLLGPSTNSLACRQIQDIQQWSLPSLLRYEDRNSMAYGVESRLPFMDYRLVELALSLPAKLKIKNGFGKWCLREITKNTVPNFIRCNRRKRGFDVTQTWIQDGLGKKIRARIKKNIHTLQPYLKKNINVEKHLTDKELNVNERLLDEALMLCWLVEPFRYPTTI